MLNAKEIKENLSNEQIIKLVTYLGAKEYIDKSEYIIFPTICHNPGDSDSSMKLYYYENKHLFMCYTECNESFDIYKLILKVAELNNQKLTFGNTFFGAFSFLLNFFNINNDYNIEQKETYTIIRNKYKKKDYDIILNEYNPIVLEVFRKYYTAEWLNEGITKEAMEKFNILYYDYANEIAIPHYDINNRLIGIRARALNENPYAKYMPIKVENTMYSHPLSLSLYGINNNKENIQKIKTAIIFEGEKSVLKCEDILSINYSVAACGDKINIFQVNLLIKECGIREIILAFDKEYDKLSSDEGKKYFNKLYTLGEKYSNYCDVSFIFDMDNLLKKKDSPVDKGKEVFNKLLKKRIMIRK